MPFVQVTSSTGRTNFKYTISTPTCANAKSIKKDVPVLLFIHPTSIAEHIFHAQFADPRLRRFNLVSFDLRGGHGQTSGDKVPPHYGQDEATEDVVLLMDALQLPPCHLVGMSTGATIATQLAISYPTRVLSLFLISHLCLEIPSEVAEGHREVYDLWISAFPDPSTVLMETVYEAGFGNAQYMFSNPSQLSPIVTSMTTVTYPVAVKKWNYHHLDQFRIMNLDFYVNRKSHSKPALARISGPVKLVCGTKDVAYPTSYSEKFLAHLIEAGVDASLHVIPGAPHYLAPDHANDMNPVLHDFIVQIEPPTTIAYAKVPSNVVSPWDDVLRMAGWDPEANDDSDDTLMIFHPNGRDSFECS